MQIETTVLGGLPVTIKWTVCPAERDVGIFDAYIDEWEIVAIHGRPCKSAEWIHSRIDSAGEIALMHELEMAGYYGS